MCVVSTLKRPTLLEIMTIMYVTKALNEVINVYRIQQCARVEICRPA